MESSLSMRRLAAVTLIVFVLVLAFLAGRVRAGADPTQAGTPASTAVRTDPVPASPDAAAPSQPYGEPGRPDPSSGAPGDDGQGVDPYGDGGGGSAVPDEGGVDPMTTQAS